MVRGEKRESSERLPVTARQREVMRWGSAEVMREGMVMTDEITGGTVVPLESASDGDGKFWLISSI